MELSTDRLTKCWSPYTRMLYKYPFRPFQEPLISICDLRKSIAARILWRNDRCDQKEGAGQAVLLRYEDDVDAFIGPGCSGGEKAIQTQLQNR